MTPEQRSLKARAAANARWARQDSAHQTHLMREGLLAKLADEIDPDHLMPEEERRRRAIKARKSRLQMYALRSAQVRAERGARGSQVA